MSTGRVLSALNGRNLVLPAVMKPATPDTFPFPWVRVTGDRIFVSGHGPLTPAGSLAAPLGKVGSDLTLDEGYVAARLTALAMMASLVDAKIDLDRLTWLRVFGMVNVAPTFHNMPAVINGFSDLILDLFGPERGAHARSAVGMAGLPFGIPVEIEAELLLDVAGPT